MTGFQMLETEILEATVSGFTSDIFLTFSY